MASDSWYRQTRWQVALFLSASAAMNYADRASMAAVLPAIRSDLGISDVSLGLLGSVFLWSYAIGSPIAGSLADRFSRTRLVVGSLVAWSVVTALMGLATGFPMLLALRLALGVTECLFLPAAIALIAEYHGPGSRARALSLISIGVNTGMVLGGSFAGYMAQHYGWRSGFWALGVGGIVLALLAKPIVPRSPPIAKAAVQRASLLEAIKYLSRVPSYYVLLTESMLSGLGLWIFFSWLPLYFKETYNMTMAAAGFAGTFMLQISVVLGIFVGGHLSDRLSAGAPHRRMLLYSVFYLAGAPFLLLFLGAPSFPVIAAGIAAFSFVRGIGQANDNPTQCEIVPPQFRSTGVGFMNAVATGVGGMGVFFAGYLKREVGLAGIFAGISGVFVLASAVLFIGYRFFIRRDIARAQAWSAAAART